MIEGFKMELISLLEFSWPMIAIGVIIAILLRVTYLLVNKQKLVLHEELFKLCFIIYILCLFYVVTFQDVSWSSHNYIPFKEILRYDFGSSLFYRNIFGNMLLFLPYGIFIAKYVKLDNTFIVLVISFITSLSIEVIQFLIGRVFDVDDILLNVIGGTLGFLIYKIFKKFSDKLPSFFQKDIFWDIISVLVLGGFIWFLVP
ncbi:MAG: VanZ family protein [Bacilli bacterium]